MITAGDSTWDVGVLSDGTGIYIAADSVAQGQHSYIKVTSADALRIGEAIIKATMQPAPENGAGVEHLGGS